LQKKVSGISLVVFKLVSLVSSYDIRTIFSLVLSYDILYNI